MLFKIFFDNLLPTNEIIFVILRYHKKLIFGSTKAYKDNTEKMANNTSVEQYVISIITEHYLRYH